MSRIGLVFLAVLSGSSLALAQTNAEDIRALVHRGQEVSITDDRGQEFNGRIDAVTVDGLDMLVDGNKAAVPYLHIVRIDHPTDSLANGALIGFGVGAALGVAVVVSARSDCPGRDIGFDCPKQSVGADAAGAAIVGGLGAAVGLAIDALIRRDPQIYRRGGGVHATVAPAVGRGVRGAAASVRW